MIPGICMRESTSALRACMARFYLDVSDGIVRALAKLLAGQLGSSLTDNLHRSM